MQDKDKIIDKIRKCLALSKSSNEHGAALMLAALWCAVTFYAARLLGIFMDDYRYLLMFWAGMAYLWGQRKLRI